MTDFDLVIRGGTVATDSDVFEADVGVRGERISVVGAPLTGARAQNRSSTTPFT